MVIVHRASFLINKHSFFSQPPKKVFKVFFFLKVTMRGSKIVVWYLVYNSLYIETGFEFDLSLIPQHYYKIFFLST